MGAAGAYLMSISIFVLMFKFISLSDQNVHMSLGPEIP